MAYYGHTTEDGRKQLLKDHLLGVSNLAKKYASNFSAGDWGYICGILHDIGKYSDAFQNKLKGEKNSVTHTSAGGEVAINEFGDNIGKVLAYAITGHHTGLKNCGSKSSIDDSTLYSRLNEHIADYSHYVNEISLDIENLKLPIKTTKPREEVAFSVSFFIRMLFSCLTDSDFIDTETFMSGKKPRGEYVSIDKLHDKFFNEIESFNKKEDTYINQKRKYILQRCINMAKQVQGLYTLTTPTGGGKTISSMAFALEHAKKHGLDRVIYVIPYTSIIEQNAKVFKDLLGQEFVLEHHSNFVKEKVTGEEVDKVKLASENWDIPIIVTTNVQFFESLFANRSSRCRKIHNISKSVIIFDEAQMIPVEFLKPCMQVICELVKNYNSTAVLCTATQPPLDKFIYKDMEIKEIMENVDELNLAFRKVKVINVGKLEDEALYTELDKQKQVLCIVNTKKYANEIYKQISGKKYHLSGYMCAMHRKEVLNKIKDALKNGEDCKVISTQLIEAGVDVDFPKVYRAMAGLDSIIQSAGRCNREGKMKTGEIRVFTPTNEKSKIRGYMSRCAKSSEEIFRCFEDVFSSEAIKRYFEILYSYEGEENLDKKKIMECFKIPLEYDFETASRSFNFIESNTVSIVIPYDKKVEKVINFIKYSDISMKGFRELQPYTVNMYENEFKALMKNDAIEIINESIFVLKDLNKNYSNEFGVIIPKQLEGEAIFT